MLALAANKNDLYDKEEVEENEGISLAKELGAIFQRTSAKEATGVEDLFEKIANKIINPNCVIENSPTNEMEDVRNNSVRLEDTKKTYKKKGCC